MAGIDRHSPGTSVALRAARLVVPWILLLVVGLVLWSLVTDYRTAVDATGSGASDEATSQPDPVAAGPYVLVLSDGLNLRAEPSTAAAVVQVLAADQQLALLEEGLGWYRVRTADGVEGWVAAGGRYTQLVTP